MPEVRVVDAAEVAAGATGDGHRSRDWSPLGAVEAPGAAEHPRRTAGPEKDRATAGALAMRGPVRRALAPLSLAARDDGVRQGFDHGRVVAQLWPVFTGRLLQFCDRAVANSV